MSWHGSTRRKQYINDLSVGYLVDLGNHHSVDGQPVTWDMLTDLLMFTVSLDNDAAPSIRHILEYSHSSLVVHPERDVFQLVADVCCELDRFVDGPYFFMSFEGQGVRCQYRVGKKKYNGTSHRDPAVALLQTLLLYALTRKFPQEGDEP